MKDLGFKTRDKDLALKNTQMGIHMRETSTMEKHMVRVLIHGHLKMRSIQDNGFKGLDMVLGNGQQEMAIPTKDNGKWANLLDLAYLNGKMGTFMKDNGRTD